MPIEISSDLILLEEFPFPFWSGLEVAMQPRITGDCSGGVKGVPLLYSLLLTF